MQQPLIDLILNATGARGMEKIATIQSLWSGYGEISRYALKGSNHASVVVKHVQLPERSRHPRGWNSARSHERKIRSYEVERHWYQHWAARCGGGCRVPQCLALDSRDHEFVMVLEDLDASGFGRRLESATPAQMEAGLSWLAEFHATFLGQAPSGLWPQGTYWHLATRPDELAALEDAQLRAAAPRIDALLNATPYQTLVHGDAKLANFCFSDDGRRVAAVDFQYVGGGCGMKDVAYFIGSCLYEEDCERFETPLLDYYFAALKGALDQRQAVVDSAALCDEWRRLYPLAWTDFHRFVKGWSPGHWKIHGYSERLAREVLAQLDVGTAQSAAP